MWYTEREGFEIYTSEPAGELVNPSLHKYRADREANPSSIRKRGIWIKDLIKIISPPTGRGIIIYGFKIFVRLP